MSYKLRFECINPEAAEQFRRYRLSLFDSEGELKREIVARDTQGSWRYAAIALGMRFGDLIEYWCKYKSQKDNGWDLLLSEKPVRQDTKFYVRPIDRPLTEALLFDDFFAALESPRKAEEEVIEWDGIEEWCCLDLDFHEGSKPGDTDIRQCADTLRPLPHAWWQSRSGGLHCMYSRKDDLSASELCALAAAKLLNRFEDCEIELLHRTRRPPGRWVRRRQDGSIEGPSAIIVDGDFAAWLSERDLIPGRRYPHTRCPVNPSPRAEANSDPVMVYEDHIYCFVCEADGIRKGSRKPGMFPLAVLAGAAKQSLLSKCVENFTHWGHARYVVGQVFRQENIADVYYRALLKLRHGHDPRIPLVFDAEPKTGLIRYDGLWCGISGRAKSYSDGSDVLSRLPVCKRPVIEGGKTVLKTDPVVVEELASTDDLTPYGYPALVRVWGIQLTQMQDLPPNKIFSLLQRNGNPQFLPVKARMPEDEAWGILDEIFPGLDRKVIELLIVAKGCSEFRTGLPPMIFLTGPTGCGKTQSLNLAASICGDTATVVTFEREQTRLRQQILVAKETGSFAFFDEYLKGAKKHNVDYDQAMEFVLNLTENSISHKLYVGPVPLGDLPVCVWADINVPVEVLSHSQIARRMHHAPLKDSKQWKEDANNIRRMDNSKLVSAADSILSHIMDRWFLPPGPTDFSTVARSLNFSYFTSDAVTAYRNRLIRELFDLVCAAPEATPQQRRGSEGRGWKFIDPHGTGDLVDTWNAVGERALRENDLRSILGTTDRIYCEILRQQKKGVLIRFVNDEKDRVNAELRVR